MPRLDPAAALTAPDMIPNDDYPHRWFGRWERPSDRTAVYNSLVHLRSPPMNTRPLLEAAARNEPVHCPVCGAELLNALTDAAAAKLRVHHGLYCPADERHFGIRVEVEEKHRQFWELFEQKQAERKRRDAAAEGRGADAAEEAGAGRTAAGPDPGDFPSGSLEAPR